MIARGALSEYLNKDDMENKAHGRHMIHSSQLAEVAHRCGAMQYT